MAKLTFLLTLVFLGIGGLIFWLSINYDPTKIQKLASSYLRKATIQINDHKYNLARPNLDIAIDLDPDLLEALYQRAVLNLKENDKKAAIGDFTSVLKIDPTFEKAYDGRGLTFFLIGDYKSAIRDFETLIKLNPILEDKTHSYFGLSLYNEHRYDEALEQFNSFLRIPGKQGEEDILLHRANCFFFKGEYERAFSETEKIIIQNPNSYLSYNLQGLILRQQGKTKEALLKFKKVMELNKSFPNVYHNVGLLVFDEKMFGRSIFYFSESIRLFNGSDNSNLIVTYKKRAAAFEIVQNFTMAIEDYTNIIEILKESSSDLDSQYPYYFDRSEAFLKNGEPDLALKDLTFVVENIPEHDGARAKRGEFYITEEGEIQKGVEDFKIALQINPRFAYCYYRLSTLFEMEMFQGKEEEKLVLKYAKKAMELRPDDELYVERVKKLQGLDSSSNSLENEDGSIMEEL